MNYTTVMGHSRKFDSMHLHRCGFEVEVSTPYTVDIAPRRDGMVIDPSMFCKLTEWAPTHDSSTQGGFELKSPIISFNTPHDIRNNIPEEVRSLVDLCTKGENCGGHIHYSNRDMTAEQTFRYMQRWAWLFALIYPLRINNHYCELTHQKPQSDKYQWLRLREKRIEVRIFPAFRKATALAWRAGLLAKMAMIQPRTVKASVDAWMTDAEQIATHVYAVRSPTELAKNFLEQKVQLQLISKLNMDPAEMKQIGEALAKGEPIE
jgi:hypothetical protein